MMNNNLYTFPTRIASALLLPVSKSLLCSSGVPQVRNSTRSIILQQKRYINLIKWYKNNAKTPSQIALKEEIESGGFMVHQRRLVEDPDGKDFAAFPLDQKIKLTWPNGKLFTYSGNVIGNLNSQSGNIVDDNELPPTTGDNSNKLPLQLSDPALLLFTNKPLFGHDFVSSWRIPFEEEFPELSVKHIVLVEETFDKWLDRYFYINITKQALRSSNVSYDSIISYHGKGYASFYSLKKQLQIKNRYNGYAALVTNNGTYAHFLGAGKATEEELDSLFDLTEALLQNDDNAHIEVNAHIEKSDNNNNDNHQMPSTTTTSTKEP